MPQGKIKLSFRIVISKNSVTKWEKLIWESTYKEFLMQSQLFSDRENPAQSFKQLLSQNEKASQLHFLVSTAAHPYVMQWKGLIYFLADNLGNNFLPFEQYRFDIIDSNIYDKQSHEIGITFTSPLLTLVDIWEGHYLVSLDENADPVNTGAETLMFKMQPRLSVSFFKP
ncbi:hypothetical protein GVN16_16000 [Emticicia sp. CRIBPO]|uniref:hypothetical protein n=1 Tax=Emticicia sp. CRIBPO TaxID=2683258 RepID=UPI0014124AEC|nr:hypothetical protein [Emticicia sp. CRIBPO]NBA87277.1 hypothetical protein [Emticicia sp. CRIBPO]